MLNLFNQANNSITTPSIVATDGRCFFDLLSFFVFWFVRVCGLAWDGLLLFLCGKNGAPKIEIGSTILRSRCNVTALCSSAAQYLIN